MRHILRHAAVLTAFVLLGVLGLQAQDPQKITVTAKKYEFTPAEIEVPVNTLVRLHLKATDKEHGFELKSVKDSCVKFKPGAPATIEFYADKAGELEFKCCKVCGMGHSKMKGKLVVK